MPFANYLAFKFNCSWLYFTSWHGPGGTIANLRRLRPESLLLCYYPASYGPNFTRFDFFLDFVVRASDVDYVWPYLPGAYIYMRILYRCTYNVPGLDFFVSKAL